jgi:16S rRNA (uracil1498-N3)-methyltransferase
MTAPLFYVEEIVTAGTMTVRGEEAKHAASAMRIGGGEVVLVGDGRGTLATCTVLTADRAQIHVRIDHVREVPAPRELTVVQAIPKGERGDLAVELLTEAGASGIVPWRSERTVSDWRGKEPAKRQRWERVARAAAKQSRRAWLPRIHDPVSGVPRVAGATLILHEGAADSLFALDLPSGPLSLVVGPEGGLTEQEVADLHAAGGRAVRMGPEIMRTSTAGAAACVWLRGLEMRLGS